MVNFGYFWSLLVTFGLLVYDTIYIYLHQKYTFGLVIHKTKSNQKWPKVKYLGSKPFLDMADNNHIKLFHRKEKGGRRDVSRNAQSSFLLNILSLSCWFQFQSLLVTFGLVDHKTKSVLLVEVYVDSVIYQKTKSNQKWQKVTKIDQK